MSSTGTEPARTPDKVSIAELLAISAPPRPDTTGVHLTHCGGDSYLLAVQGPESRYLTARILDFVQALHDQALEKAAND